MQGDELFPWDLGAFLNLFSPSQPFVWTCFHLSRLKFNLISLFDLAPPGHSPLNMQKNKKKTPVLSFLSLGAISARKKGDTSSF